MTTYTYSETGSTNPSAPTSIGSGSLTYDTNGNLTAYNATKYTWDYRNRVTAIGNGTATTTFAYDHTFERVKKVSGGVSTYYINDLYNKAGATTTIYIYDNTGTLIATIEGNGTATTTEYQHQDHLGGTQVLTSAYGNVVSTLDYYPFGDTRISTGSFTSKRNFIGEVQDLETDLNYLNARYYDSNRGQFLSQDPVFWEVGESEEGQTVLLLPQLQNSYSYASNNPVSQKDPDGRIVDTIIDIGFIIYDLYRVGDAYINGGDVQSEIGYLGLDVAGAATPLATGFGAVARTSKVVTRTENSTQGSIKIGEAGGVGSGKRFSQKVQDEARLESGNKCVFCGIPTTQGRSGPTQSNIDHAIPKADGGNNTINNAQNTCRSCNLEKGRQSTIRYLQNRINKLTAQLNTLKKQKNNDKDSKKRKTK